MDNMKFTTLKIDVRETVCFIQLYRPEANNTINQMMVSELTEVFGLLTDSNCTIVVLEGLPKVFCFGADFSETHEAKKFSDYTPHDPEPLYDLWYRMATGPQIIISHVRGNVNAGGVGFVASSDVVIADESAVFSLSELLFGLIPACVMPFLIRRIGFQKAHYLAMTTQKVTVKQALDWGLVDAYQHESQDILRAHLLRLRKLSSKTIGQYKSYMTRINPILSRSKNIALITNKEVFNDGDNMAAIGRFVENGVFPWEDTANVK